MRTLAAILIVALAYAAMLSSVLIFSESITLSLIAISIISVLAFNFGVLISIFGGLLLNTNKPGRRN